MANESALQKQLQGYRLTTAEILLPTCPTIPACCSPTSGRISTSTPRYPVLRRFLEFWSREIEGPLHSVRVGSVKLIQPARWKNTPPT